MFQASRDSITPLLDPYERLLWSGQPLRGIRFREKDAESMPFFIGWCGFAILWEVVGILSGTPFFFHIPGFVFVTLGLYVAIGRFIIDAYKRAKTTYGVTNERIFLHYVGFPRQTKSLLLHDLKDITLYQRSDGSGTITFGPQNKTNVVTLAQTWPDSDSKASPTFDLIENVKDIYEIILNARNVASGKI